MEKPARALASLAAAAAILMLSFWNPVKSRGNTVSFAEEGACNSKLP
jgi:hypothetical protein